MSLIDERAVAMPHILIEPAAPGRSTLCRSSSAPDGISFASPSGECPTVTSAASYIDTGPLQRFRTFESRDIDETREHISRIMELQQLVPVRRAEQHKGTVSLVRLGSTVIGTISFGHMRVDAGDLAGYHLLIFCTRGSARIDLPSGEVDISGHKGICVAAGERFRAEFSHDCEQFFLRIPEEALADCEGSSRTRLREDVDAFAKDAQPWMGLLRQLTASVQTLQLVQESETIGKDFERLLVRMLVAGQRRLDEPEKPYRIVPACVRRAEKFMRAHLFDPIMLEDVAAAAGVPTRSLLNSFRQFRQSSPMRVLRAMRLEHVREKLLHGDAGTIAELASEAGFGHLSRFAQYYKQQFGESPSRTLNSRIRG